VYDTLISIESIGDVRILKVGNEIDLANADVLERYLNEASADVPAFVVSLVDCRYIDSSGLRPIIRLAGKLGSAFAVVAPPGKQIRRIFDLTGLYDHMHVCDTVEDALAKVVVRKAVS
jgi:anti-anti-sigma factor